MLMWTLALGDVMERVFGVSGVVRAVEGGGAARRAAENHSRVVYFKLSQVQINLRGRGEH